MMKFHPLTPVGGFFKLVLLIVWQFHHYMSKYICPAVIVIVTVIALWQVSIDASVAKDAAFLARLAFILILDMSIIVGLYYYGQFASRQVNKIKGGKLPWPWPAE
jgi:hypothetical protein